MPVSSPCPLCDWNATVEKQDLLIAKCFDFIGVFCPVPGVWLPWGDLQKFWRTFSCSPSCIHCDPSGVSRFLRLPRSSWPPVFPLLGWVGATFKLTVMRFFLLWVRDLCNWCHPKCLQPLQFCTLSCFMSVSHHHSRSSQRIHGCCAPPGERERVWIIKQACK